MTPSLENIIIFGASSFLGRNLRKAFLNIDVKVFSVFRNNSSYDEDELTGNEHHIYFDDEIKSLDVLKDLSKDLIDKLKSLGINVVNIISKRNKLEELFMDLTKEEITI